ncbi:carbamoyltransferase [Candidatus Woesearchaeota archaeon]|nr:carbamoyltransferase [Candidatus Woesearchaeota archaeon]
MYILGLNIGHNATACLLKDGKIIWCISEERFSRIKNHTGFPILAVKYILMKEKISVQDLDKVVLDDHYSFVAEPYNFGTVFFQSYTQKSFRKRMLGKLIYSYPTLSKPFLNWKFKSVQKKKPANNLHLRQTIASFLHLPLEKIAVIDHHLAHASGSCFNLPTNKKTLVFTLDGEGSCYCASVSIFDGKELRLLSKTRKESSLGYLYAIATIKLGMKPLEHEFKVMGLAPYAKEHNIQKIYPKFESLFHITDDLRFESRFSMPYADFFFDKELRHVRFDIIAGAVQKLTEELTLEWIQKAIATTGIYSIALSGGVFMNVKANMNIASLPEVKDIFIMPSCGDESNAIGCCYYGYTHFGNTNTVEPLQDLYLGPGYNDAEILSFLKSHKLEKKYAISTPKDIEKEVAKLLAKNEIVARFSGRSEWGARALGNRSILANPSSSAVIRVLNEVIKDRDFWMPFTPSILDTAQKKYLVNPKKLFAPYMVVTFPSTAKAQEELMGAMHPYDFTLRPQVVLKEWNPGYYHLLEEFQKLTGIGGVLNTSFNLHGEPNVCSPADAIHTVENSGIKYLALNGYLLQKKGI